LAGSFGEGFLAPTLAAVGTYPTRIMVGGIRRLQNGIEMVFTVEFPVPPSTFVKLLFDS